MPSDDVKAAQKVLAAMHPQYEGRRRWLQWAIGPVLLALLLLAQMQPAAAAPSRTVLVLGDSLSAAYGLAPSQGWVALMGQRIARDNPGWKVVNASVSGETTAGGAARVVREVVLHRPTIVVIELGANDGLRGLPLPQMQVNLARMIGAAHGVGANVLLVGMRIPPNYGPEYTQGFEQAYRDLAKRFDTKLLPFLLQPIALDRSAFQDDNLHPVAKAEPALRDHVWTVLGPMLQQVDAANR